jgi:hypothetical protein
LPNRNAAEFSTLLHLALGQPFSIRLGICQISFIIHLFQDSFMLEKKMQFLSGVKTCDGVACYKPSIEGQP